MNAIYKNGGGKQLIGIFVVQNKPFKAVGKIIDYRKIKDKGAGKDIKIGGHYLIDFGKEKRFWRTWSDLDMNWEIKQIYQSAYENGNHDFSVKHSSNHQGICIMNCPNALIAFKTAS